MADGEAKDTKKLQSNAPYYVSLFGAMQHAKGPIIAVNATFNAVPTQSSQRKVGNNNASDPSINSTKEKKKNRSTKSKKDEIARVDLVADGGREWIKLSS